MKKFTSLLLIAMMALSLVSVAAFTSSAEDTIPWQMYGTGMENWSGNTQLLLQADMPETLIGDTTTPWTITFTWDGGSKTVSQCSTSHYRWKADEPKTIQRFTIVIADQANQFIPEVGVEYTVTATVTKDGTTYNFAGETPFVLPVEPIVPEDYNYGEAPIVPDIPEEVAFDIEVYGSGFENWAGSSNKGDEAGVVQMLICPKIAGAKAAALYATDIEWTFTIAGNDGSSKTVTLVQSSQYDGGSWGIVRFEPVLTEQANQFIPVPGVAYTVSATVVAGETTYVGTSAADAFTWPTQNDDGTPYADPIVPDAYDYSDVPVEPVIPEIEVTPYQKGWENWSEQTQLLIVAPYSAEAESYTWEITLGDKTFTLAPSSNYDFGNGTAIWRFETCLGEGENQFIPVAGTTYTVSAKVYNADNELVYTVKSAQDAVWEVPADFEPIVPEVEEPVTGDATVYAIVFAVVALMGMGVVVTKKVRA